MELHNLKPAEGSTKNRKRVGRGEGSKRGGTSTRGHNGAKSRSGYSRKIGFEGGQQPLQRRLPKFGFSSRVSLVKDSITLTELTSLEGEVVDLAALKNAGLINKGIKFVKVILSS